MLEVGVGTGLSLSEYSTHLEVVGIDLGDGVESAFALTRNLPNVHIVQCDIFKLPFKKAFDYAFSDRQPTHQGAAPQLMFRTITTAPFEVLGAPVQVLVTDAGYEVLTQTETNEVRSA